MILLTDTRKILLTCSYCSDVEGDQTDLVSNGDVVDQNNDEEVTRKPKKRKQVIFFVYLKLVIERFQLFYIYSGNPYYFFISPE